MVCALFRRFFGVSKLPVPCPVCFGKYGKSVTVEKSFLSAFVSFDHQRSVFFRCLKSRSLFWYPPFEIAYQTYGGDPSYFKYYFEYDAGLSFMASLIMPFRSFLGNQIRILEIGGGVGFLLKMLQLANSKKGFYFLGLEPSLITHGKDFSLTERNLPGFFPKDLRDNKPFDLIFCSEVIEHIGDFRSFLKNISDHLSDHGVAILTTPNADAYASERAYNKFATAGYGQHLTIFSASALELLVRELGVGHMKLCHSEGITGKTRHIIFISKDPEALKQIQYKVPSDNDVQLWFKDLLGAYSEEIQGHPNLPVQGREYLLLGLLARRIEILVNKALWQEAKVEFARFASRFESTYKIQWVASSLKDFYTSLATTPWEESEFFKFVRFYPCFLVRTLYYHGIFCLNGVDAPKQAVDFFNLAVQFSQLEKYFIFFAANESIWHLSAKHLELAQKRIFSAS